GTVVAFYEYIQRFFIPIRDLSTKYTIIQSSLAAWERIFALLDVDERDAAGPAPSADEGAQSAAETTDEAAIVFDDVSFGYREGQQVLEHVSLTIGRGERVAVVGATGSGKTTLTSLLLRLYDITEGTIRVDGVDVRALERGSLRWRFGIVPQEAF